MSLKVDNCDLILIELAYANKKLFRDLIKQYEIDFDYINKLFMNALCKNTIVAAIIFNTCKNIDLHYCNNSPMINACITGRLGAMKFIYKKCSNFDIHFGNDILMQKAKELGHRHIIRWLESFDNKKIVGNTFEDLVKIIEGKTEQVPEDEEKKMERAIIDRILNMTRKIKKEKEKNKISEHIDEDGNKFEIYGFNQIGEVHGKERDEVHSKERDEVHGEERNEVHGEERNEVHSKLDEILAKIFEFRKK